MTTVDTHRITDFVLGVIRDMLNMPLPPTISPATPLGADGLELESLSFVELTVHVEREYGIQVDDETVDGFAHTTLGELVDVHRHQFDRRMVVGAFPPEAFEKAVDDHLAVRQLAYLGHQRRDLRSFARFRAVNLATAAHSGQ